MGEVKLKEANLTPANLASANLASANLASANLALANLAPPQRGEIYYKAMILYIHGLLAYLATTRSPQPDWIAP